MRLHGRLKFLSEKGFGFISRDDGIGDVFVHATAVTESGLKWPLDVGCTVRFDVRPSDRKPGQFMATNIEIVNSARADLNPSPVQFGSEVA
jgi:CspA family cold shock protein